MRPGAARTHAADPTDPVAHHVAALAAAVHGPRGAKARMAAEVREGLTDAAAARTARGTPYARAAREAVREFGTVAEVAPEFQRELTVAQTRHTARALALSAPLLAVCCLLAWTAAGSPGHQAGAASVLSVPFVLAALTAVGAVLAGLAGLAALLTTGAPARLLPRSALRRLPGAVAWAGTSVAVTMALATLALAATSAFTADWPLLACAGALTAAVHGVVAASARGCRRCARLPVT